MVNQIVEAQGCAVGGAAGRVDCRGSSGKGSTHRRGEYLIHLDQPVTLAGEVFDGVQKLLLLEM